jgi:hypothetical protein
MTGADPPAAAGPHRQPGLPAFADRPPRIDDETQPPISVGDLATRKPRLLACQCNTCVFRPGNLTHLAEGRLADLVQHAIDGESFVVCHDTLPRGPFPHTLPAICRGFDDRYDTTALQTIGRLFGFTDREPPIAG